MNDIRRDPFTPARMHLQEAAGHVDDATDALDADLPTHALAHATIAQSTALLAMADMLEALIDAVREQAGPECVAAREARELDQPGPRLVDDTVFAPVVSLPWRPDGKDLRP